MMKPIHILLIEDNEGDILLTMEAFEESKINNEITIRRDGKAAIDYFETLKKGESVPQLVLLDINLPKKCGYEVLSYIKNSVKYRPIPVIILTTSSSEKDILKAYEDHVNCFITKPIEVDDFMQVIAKIEDFWINIVSTPKI